MALKANTHGQIALKNLPPAGEEIAKPARVARQAAQAKPRPAKPAATAAPKGKWVYASAAARPPAAPACAICLAARARASPRWRISGCRCRPASPSPPRSAPISTQHGKTYPKDLKPQVEAALAEVGRITGKKFGDAQESAAGLGALRRPRLDAGHDRHRAQSRPQRRDRGGAGGKIRRPALRL